MVKPLRVLALAFLIPACGGGGGSGGGAGGPAAPNIIVLVADDLGYADLGVQGSAEALTPHIDSIAARGVRCTNGYVSGPVCSPTRAGLLTGRYQQRFGHEKNILSANNNTLGMPTSEITLADRLKTAGYATGLVGKWHLGVQSQFHPQSRGFDEFFGFLWGQHSYYTWNQTDNPMYRGTTEVVESTYLTDAFARESVDFIHRHRTRPFFLYLAFNAVHTPMEAPPAAYMDRFPAVADPARKKYLAMLAAMDDAVGAVLAKLRDEGLEERTLVFFLSDNGGPTAVNTAINDPLSGVKGEVKEGGVRVPFLAQWPGVLPAGAVYEKPVIALDVFTTAVAAAGGAVPQDRPIDGVDLRPFLQGARADDPHDTLFWKYGSLAAVRKGDWKLHQTGSQTPLLFDLGADIGETTDVAGAHPAVVDALKADLDAWKAELVPPLW